MKLTSKETAVFLTIIKSQYVIKLLFKTMDKKGIFFLLNDLIDINDFCKI